MNKLWMQRLRALFEIIYLSLPGACLLILADDMWGFQWPHAAAFALSVLFQALLFWSEERGLRLQSWGLLLLLNAAGFFVFKTGDVRRLYLVWLGLEGAAAAAAVFGYLSRRRMWLKTPAVLLMLSGLVYLCTWKVAMPKWEVCVFLFAFLLFLAEAAERKNPGLREQGGKNMLYLFPLFLAGIVFLSCLPVKAAPIRWELLRQLAGAVKQKAASVITGMEYFFTQDDGAYSISFTGYSDEGKLGGSILSVDTAQLSAEGTKTESPLYLSGNILTEYTGQGWEKQGLERPYTEEEYLADYRELLAALSTSGYTQQELQEITRQRRFRINYEGVRTKSVFIAPSTSSIQLPKGAYVSGKQSDAVTMSKPAGPGFSYEIYFMEVDYASEKMRALMRQEGLEGLETDSAGEARRAFIRDTCTQLPEGLPARVYELADEITRDAGNDYDKLKAIEAYLNGFSYTTSPEEVPEGRDFTDYFLFESKSGYCTYFATAMAVLGRCEGIPTRYVEGFVTKNTCTGEGSRVEITGKDAHAWTEAYIEHVGWVPFEPTPGYEEFSNTAWKQPEAAADIPAGAAPPVVEGRAHPAGEVEAPASMSEEEQELRALLVHAGKAVLLLSAVCALVICFMAARGFLGRRSYAAKSSYDKILCLMKRTLLLGALCSCPIEDGETLAGYRERIQERLDTKGAAFAQICGLYQEIRFGGRAVGAEELRLFEGYVKKLEEGYLESRSLPRRIWYKCVN